MYKWSHSLLHAPYGDSEPVFQALEGLRDKAPLTLDRVLEAAENPASPLHHFVEWNGRIAARRYQRQQLGQLLRAIVRVDERGRVHSVYARVNPADEAPYYDLIERVLRNPARRRAYARRLYSQLESIKARSAELPEMRGVVAAINRVLQRTPARIRA